MALRDVVLGLLVDRPDHGYNLKRRLSPGLPTEHLINDGVLYPLLKRLEREGLLESMVERHRGRERLRFSATAPGRHAFLEWLRSDAGEDYGPSYEMYVTHPLVKLLFSEHLSDSERLGKLRRHVSEVRKRLATLDRLRQTLDPRGTHTLNSAWLELEIAQQRQRLDGLSELIAQCQEQAPTQYEQSACSS